MSSGAFSILVEVIFGSVHVRIRYLIFLEDCSVEEGAAKIVRPHQGDPAVSEAAPHRRSPCFCGPGLAGRLAQLSSSASLEPCGFRVPLCRLGQRCVSPVPLGSRRAVQ